MGSRAADLAASLNAALGEGTVRVGSDPSLKVRYWPTEVLPFDVLLGGGLPAGRSIEIYGDYSTLKSYMALRAIASVQRRGGTAGLVDTEHAFDPSWAEQLGVDTDELITIHPANGEDAVMVSEALIRDGIDLLVWDSVAATIPKAYAEARPGEDQQPARLASLMSKGLQRMNAANTRTALLFINQTRVNVGMSFGPKESNPGGKALGFYSSMRVRFVKGGKIQDSIKTWDGEKYIDSKQTIAMKIKATLEKSKLNKPLREGWFSFDLESGSVDDLGFLIAQGLETGLITYSNARWTIPEILEDSIHGKDKFKDWLQEDEEVQQWLRDQIVPTVPIQSPASSPTPSAAPGRKKGGRSKPES